MGTCCSVHPTPALTTPSALVENTSINSTNTDDSVLKHFSEAHYPKPVTPRSTRGRKSVSILLPPPSEGGSQGSQGGDSNTTNNSNPVFMNPCCNDDSSSSNGGQQHFSSADSTNTTFMISSTLNEFLDTLLSSGKCLEALGAGGGGSGSGNGGHGGESSVNKDHLARLAMRCAAAAPGCITPNPTLQIDRATFLNMTPGASPLFLERFFAVFDLNGDGTITLEEYLTAAIVLSSTHMTQEKIDLTFRLWDINGDGTITAEELVELLMAAAAEEGLILSRDQGLELVRCTLKESSSSTSQATAGSPTHIIGSPTGACANSLNSATDELSLSLEQYSDLVRKWPRIVDAWTWDMGGGSTKYGFSNNGSTTSMSVKSRAGGSQGTNSEKNTPALAPLPPSPRMHSIGLENVMLTTEK